MSRVHENVFSDSSNEKLKYHRGPVFIYTVWILLQIKNFMKFTPETLNTNMSSQSSLSYEMVSDLLLRSGNGEVVAR